MFGVGGSGFRVSVRSEYVSVRSEYTVDHVLRGWRRLTKQKKKEVRGSAFRVSGIGGPDVIRKEAWPFYRTISGIRLC
jgi:hypothetical protein